MSEIVVNSATQMIVLDPPLLNAIFVSGAGTPEILIEQVAPVEVIAQVAGQALVIPPAEIIEIAVSPAGSSFHVILAGPEGPQGPQGPMGIADDLFRYIHTQAVASTTWIIDHDLNGYPQVTIFEPATGDIVEGDPIYISSNQLSVIFSSPISGTAYLS